MYDISRKVFICQPVTTSRNKTPYRVRQLITVLSNGP